MALSDSEFNEYRQLKNSKSLTDSQMQRLTELDGKSTSTEIAPKKSIVGENKATAIRGKYPSERLFGPLTEGLAQAGAAMKAGPLPFRLGLPFAGAIGTGLEIGRQATQAAMGEPGAPKTFTESIRRQLGAFGEGMLGEAGGRALFGLAGAVIPSGYKLTPFQQSLRANFEARGIPYTPADIAQTKGLSLLESTSEKTPFGGEVLQKFRTNQIQALKTAAEDMVAKTGGKISHEEAGDIIVNSIKDASIRHANKRNIAYRVAYDLTNLNTPVKTVSSRTEAQNILGEPVYGRIRNMNMSNAAQEIVKKIATTEKKVGKTTMPYRIGDLIRDAEDLNKYITAETAEQKLKGLAYGSSKEGMYLTKLRNAVQKDIDTYFEKQGGKEAENAYKFAKALHGEGKQTFDTRFVKNLVKTDPGKVVDYVVNLDNPTALTKIKDIVGDDAFNAIRRRTMQNFVEGSFGTIPEQNTRELFFKHSAIKNMISSYKPETLEALFGKDGVKQLEEIVKVSNAMQSAERLGQQKSGTAQISNIMGNMMLAFTSPITAIKTATGSIGVPHLYAKLITSKAGRDLILDGMKIKPGTKEAAKFITRFMTFGTTHFATEMDHNKKIEAQQNKFGAMPPTSYSVSESKGTAKK